MTTLAGTADASGASPAARSVAATRSVARGPFPRLTAAQIRTRSVAAMAAARTVHVVGTVLVHGKRFGVDLQLGTDVNGTLTYQGGGSVTIRRIGSSIYLRPDDAYYTAHGHKDLIADRHATWIEIGPDDGDYAGILPLTQLRSWTALLSGVRAVSRKPSGTIGGIPTVALIGGRSAKSTVLYVATRGAALPVYVGSVDRVDHLALLQWNAAVTVNTPSQANLRPEPGDGVLDIPKDPVATAQAFGILWRS
jgi:hypothetical protein